MLHSRLIGTITLNKSINYIAHGRSMLAWMDSHHHLVCSRKWLERDDTRVVSEDIFQHSLGGQRASISIATMKKDSRCPVELVICDTETIEAIITRFAPATAPLSMQADS